MYTTRPATEVWGPKPVSTDLLWTRDTMLYRTDAWTGFLGKSSTQTCLAGKAGAGPRAQYELWLRSKKITENNEVYQVNLRADEGHSSECIQSSWHYSKADVEKGDGLSIPAAPLGERVRLIPLTKGIHVLMPLRAQSAKHILYQTSIQAALRHVPRPHLPETIPLPAQQAIDPTEAWRQGSSLAAMGAEGQPSIISVEQQQQQQQQQQAQRVMGPRPAAPEAENPEDELQSAQEPTVWWGEVMFLGDAAIHADVVDAAAAVLAGQAGPNAEAALRVADCSSRVLQSAHAYVKQQREAQTLAFESRPGEHTSCAASAFLGGKQGRFCRLSLSVAYCSPPSAAPVAHQSVCEPCMVDITPSHTLDLGKMLAGHVPGPSLQPDDTSAWMLPLLQHAAASTAALGAGCTLFQEGGVTCQATQVCYLPEKQLLESSGASGKVVVGANFLADTEPDMAYAIAGAGVAPEDVELPDLGSLWSGSPIDIRVPSGYSLSTYPDGGYMIAADHFGAALQPVPPGSPHPWACEWGVMGFGGNWSRVRAFFRADGWIDKWQTIQFFIH